MLRWQLLLLPKTIKCLDTLEHGGKSQNRPRSFGKGLGCFFLSFRDSYFLWPESSVGPSVLCSAKEVRENSRRGLLTSHRTRQPNVFLHLISQSKVRCLPERESTGKRSQIETRRWRTITTQLHCIGAIAYYSILPWAIIKQKIIIKLQVDEIGSYNFIRYGGPGLLPEQKREWWSYSCWS